MNQRLNRRFCAVDSAAAGDPLAGSAAHLERNLLISWPRPRWERSLRRASDMPDAVATRLEAIAEAGRRVNLIHRRGEPAEIHQVFLMPEREAYRVPRDELDAFLDALARGESLASWWHGTVSRPLLLCCTHGKKDKCCAKFGFAAYKALAAAATEHQLPIEVWESTHLGGCRLAASAVILPQLRKYGRIAEPDARPLLESEARGRPYLPCYRGNSRLSPVQQCAEVAALEWLAARGVSAEVEAVSPAAAEAEAPTLAVRWRAGTQQGQLEVRCRAETLLRHDTCADYAGDGATPSQVWRAETVHDEASTRRITAVSRD